MKEAGDFRKRKDCLMVKAVEGCPGELALILASATEFVCDVGQVT